MQLSNSLTLFDVFVFPNFNINLLSFHKLRKDSECNVVFNEHNCYIQDLQSKGTMETGNLSSGLYYLENIYAGSMLKNHVETNIMYIRSDNGTKFLNIFMKTSNENKGMLHQTSRVNTP